MVKLRAYKVRATVEVLVWATNLREAKLVAKVAIEDAERQDDAPHRRVFFRDVRPSRASQSPSNDNQHFDDTDLEAFLEWQKRRLERPSVSSNGSISRVATSGGTMIETRSLL